MNNCHLSKLGICCTLSYEHIKGSKLDPIELTIFLKKIDRWPSACFLLDCKLKPTEFVVIRGPFLEAPGNYQPHKAVLFSIPNGSFWRFENCTVKVSAKETKLTLLEIRTHTTFLETLVSKYDFGPVKLPSLSRKGP